MIRSQRILIIMSSGPKVSVITVVLNNEHGLQSTVQSVVEQSYPHLEYILIDGGSTDGTLDIIAENHPHLAFCLSEPDQGIYDAMNKGVDKATGDYVLFLNAGDSFFHPKVLADLIQQVEPPAQNLLYLCHAMKNTGGVLRAKSSAMKKLFSLPACHQAILYPIEALRRLKFDLRFGIASDYHHYQRISAEYRSEIVDLVLVTYDTSGISTRRRDLLESDLQSVYKDLGTSYISAPLLWLDGVFTRIRNSLMN
jgi:glycosyltransferase involved in cell wall biosynthesis